MGSRRLCFWYNTVWNIVDHYYDQKWAQIAWYEKAEILIEGGFYSKLALTILRNGIIKLISYGQYALQYPKSNI